LLKYNDLQIGTLVVVLPLKIVLMKTKLYTLFVLFIVFYSSAVLQGQTVCNNETVRFRETFGNTAFTEAYEDGKTGFKFMTGADLEIGEYAVLNNAQARPEWHSSADHTGDPNGQMMIINPGYSDGDFYADSIDNLTTAGYYSVSLYVMNVTKSGTCGAGAVLPRLQIQIEYLSGLTAYQHLSSYTSDYIPSATNPGWVKVICGFVLPPGIQNIRYRIINQSLGDCGNSVAIDDITFSQCASLSTLPVKGLKINSIESAGSGTRIRFSTETESQTEQMITQKSTDGINWADIHVQPAAGNSEQIRNYTATDIYAASTVIYYRIRQTDLKGGVSYSAIMKYTAGNVSTSTLTAYPTPFTSQLHLNFTSLKNETYTATLYAANGLALQSNTVNAQKGNNLVQFNTINLKQGTYLVTVVNSDGSIRLTQKTVKQ
jgi:Secretion system C-terminal sorting domain